LTLGRSNENQATFADARMSRVHARIVADGGGFAIEDLGSSNGTYVDGRAVSREVLLPGSVVTLGDTNLRVTADG
jgi:pSer/pThr/pTyr-binding forkhead associated (FHA) protein